MDIICAKTGRHFNSVVAARRCSTEHNRCNACPWVKIQDGTEIHFITHKATPISQQALDKLMVDINKHLTRSKNIRDAIMPKRADETCLNIHPHPPACNCSQCCSKRKERLVKQAYPYPATMNCPSCGHFSLYYSGKMAKYVCMNTKCNAEGQTLKEVSVKK